MHVPRLCSLDNNGIGGYYDKDQGYTFVGTPEGPTALAEALKGNSTLTSLS